MGVYGPAIAGVNLIILISSTVLIYFGNILINFYLIDTLGEIFIITFILLLFLRSLWANKQWHFNQTIPCFWQINYPYLRYSCIASKKAAVGTIFNYIG